AGYTLGELYQQVRTNHFGDLLENVQGVMERLRPLGIEAAPGYAMVALACFHMRQTDAALLDQAVVWWDRASLLMSPVKMVNRFEELAVIQHGPRAAAKAADEATSSSSSSSSSDTPTDISAGPVGGGES